jgi:hypothetical protein
LLETGRRQGEILVEEGFITKEELVLGVRTQLREIVYNLMLWEKGNYIIRWEQPLQESIFIERNLYELILRGMRRVRSFSRLREVLYPWDRVVILNTNLDMEEAKQIRLKEDERMVLEEVNGKQTVGEIVEKAPLPDFEVMQILYGLSWARLILFQSRGEGF